MEAHKEKEKLLLNKHIIKSKLSSAMTKKAYGNENLDSSKFKSIRQSATSRVQGRAHQEAYFVV